MYQQGFYATCSMIKIIVYHCNAGTIAMTHYMVKIYSDHVVFSWPSVESIKIIVTLLFVIYLHSFRAFGPLCNHFHGGHVTLLFVRWASSPGLNRFSLPPSFSNSCCALWVLSLQWFVESHGIRLTACEWILARSSMAYL